MRAKDYPGVLPVNESANNVHGLHIMYSLNHKNIVHMEAASRKLQKGDGISIFIEECDDDMLSHCWDVMADNFGQMPSETFQSIVR